MEKLLKGVRNFKKTHYSRYKELFVSLNEHQTPHTLFITCSDSRIVPHLLTDTDPGELFLIRNVANIIPPYHESKNHSSVASGLEYAVTILNVQDIIVCGHSNCGGCRSFLMNDEESSSIPQTRLWTQPFLQETMDEIKKHPGLTDDSGSGSIEKINIVNQIKHLETYPFIQEKLHRKELNIHGWYYKIGTGEVLIYNPESDKFQLIE